MYKRIEAELVLKGISKKDLSKILNMHYNTLLLKFAGSSKFTLDEALKIKQVLGVNVSVEDLFAQIPDQKGA